MSTPIETNTEELQEVLQQVYNLPSRSGGSTTPDLVIVVDGSSLSSLDDINNSHVSIESGNLANTIEKIQNGQYASVLLKLTTVYDMQTYWQVTYPESVGVTAWSNESPSLAVKFYASFYPANINYYYAYRIQIDMDGTIYLERKNVAWGEYA